jgi:mono/diheme cytochrome c family protein
MTRLVIVLAVLCVACGSAKRGEPVAGPFILSGKVAQGELLFMRFCNECHPQGEGGLGPSLNEKPLPKFAVKTQIRDGLGAMPSFSKEKLSDEEVEAIADYVRALHDRP